MSEQTIRMLRLPQVMEMTGMKETFIREAMKKGEFPQSIEMGMRCRAWIESEVAEWVKSRIQSQRNIILLKEQKARKNIGKGK